MSTKTGIKLSDGTFVREAPAGLLAIKGERELHLLGTSVDAIQRSRVLLAEHGFDGVYRCARRAPRPIGPRVRFLKLSGV